VLDTVDLRAQGAGRGSFQWNVPSSVDPATLSFRVVAKAGTAGVGATSYSIDTVSSVSTGPNGLTVGLARLGETEFSKVKAVAGSDRPAS
jgi:flagellar hook assembly protein FlgD